MNPQRLIEMFEVKENPINESFNFQMARNEMAVLKSQSFTNARSAFKAMYEAKELYARGELAFKVLSSDRGYYFVLMTMAQMEVARSFYFVQKADCIDEVTGILSLTNQDGLVRIIEDQ